MIIVFEKTNMYTCLLHPSDEIQSGAYWHMIPPVNEH